MNRSPFKMGFAKKSDDGGRERDSKQKFPWILHQVLEDAEKNDNDHIVAWSESGISFKVHKRDELMKQILPQYFRQTKFKSFVRQLNLWGFSFVDHGAEKGAYYNSMFVRGQPDLCKQMRRQKVKSKSDLVETRTCGEESSNSSSTHSTISQVSRNSTVQRSNLGMLLLPREYSEITPHHRNSPPMDQRNTHPHGFPTNEINERVTGRGDWLDRLEAMYTPTDLQLSSAGKFSGGDSRGSGGDSRGNQYWLNLEPTPIRTDLLGDKKPKALPQKNDLKVFQPPHS